MNMKLNDVTVSRAILRRYMEKLDEYLESDVAVVGAGPAGLMCALRLAQAGVKVCIFERKLSIGGGMWGGGMMFNEIVFGKDARRIFDELGIPVEEYEEKGYYTADAVCAITTIASKATIAGAKVFNLLSVEDVAIDGSRIIGLVLNWSSVEIACLHVDPITMYAKIIVESSGHPSEVAHLIKNKVGGKLLTRTGGIVGEGSMCAEVGEKTVVENTKEFYPNVWAVGMAANAIFGAPRMGPIFGGMIISGEKAAEDIIRRLKSKKK